MVTMELRLRVGDARRVKRQSDTFVLDNEHTLGMINLENNADLRATLEATGYI